MLRAMEQRELRKESVHWLLHAPSARLQDAKDTERADVAQDWGELPLRWKAERRDKDFSEDGCPCLWELSSVDPHLSAK